MDVRNCKSCGRLFNYMGKSSICPACEKKLDDKYHEVKEYIYNNPGANINEVSEENDVSVNQIKKWIRDEKLSFADDSPVGLACESCGKIIKTGRFCKECKSKVASGLENLIEKPKAPEMKKDPKENPKMRFLN